MVKEDPEKSRGLVRRAAEKGDIEGRVLYVEMMLNEVNRCSEDTLVELNKYCREIIAKEEDNPEQPQVTNEYGDLERSEAEAFTERKKFGNSTITESQLHHTNPLVSPVIKGPESKMRKSMFRYGIEDGLGEEELEYPDEKDRANQRPRIPAAAGERILGVFNDYR